jgi:hypothetical protein
MPSLSKLHVPSLAQSSMRWMSDSYAHIDACARFEDGTTLWYQSGGDLKVAKAFLEGRKPKQLLSSL